MIKCKHRRWSYVFVLVMLIVLFIPVGVSHAGEIGISQNVHNAIPFPLLSIFDFLFGKEDEAKETVQETQKTSSWTGPIEINDEGARVKELQKLLIKKGYLDDIADGKYGPKTQKAVEDYQKVNGFKTTGIVDKSTFFSLFPNGLETEDPDVIIVDGYTKLQSMYLSLPITISEEDLLELGKKYGMHVYNNSDDWEFSCRYVYICPEEYTEYKSGSQSYEFGDNDYIEVVYDGDYQKFYYHFGTYIKGTRYSVTRGATAESVDRKGSIAHGWMSVESYSSDKEAMDAALELYK